MKNPFIGWSADAIASTIDWFSDVETTLAGLLQRCHSSKIEVFDAQILVDRLEDALSDSRGAMLHLAEARTEANQNAKGYAQAVGIALRAAG